ncbi:MAG: GMC family oxidoreductase [Pseudomonadaceae bacterium]|nr:GMC family oxidoreductase [Pseudomonadaceae bacterium]
MVSSPASLHSPKPTALVIGAGLGGCVLAHRLCRTHDVTLVEGGQALNLQETVTDTAHPALTKPHVASGWGGTTQFWHNGLIEIPPAVFAQSWPISDTDLAPYYAQAYPLLGGVEAEALTHGHATLVGRYTAMGLPVALLGQRLFYPRARRNLWHTLGLAGKVTQVEGVATALIPNTEGTAIQGVTVHTAHGVQTLSADVVVLATGGLGTPALLQPLQKALPLPALAHAGVHYEDHPFAFVGEVSLNVPLYKLWNFWCPHTKGNLRLVQQVEHKGLHISFQLRPAAIHWAQVKRTKIDSALNGLRNQPFNPKHYLKLLTQWDDVLDILSFKLNLRLPTSRYSILMVAEQPPSPTCAIAGPPTALCRTWQFSKPYLATLQEAIQIFLKHLGPIAHSPNIFLEWPARLQSSSHHSGTARMAASPSHGVCDADACVFGLSNLYVADGSLIPASGYTNTGLTIAALALRLADHLQGTPPRQSHT